MVIKQPLHKQTMTARSNQTASWAAVGEGDSAFQQSLVACNDLPLRRLIHIARKCLCFRAKRYRRTR